jgi:hypothetical protein
METLEQEATGTETKERNRTPLTPEQRQAAGIRREITMLQKYPGNEKVIADLTKQADALAPASKQSKRVDPLAVFTTKEQNDLKNYFRTTAGFARLCQVVSAKKLQEIVEGIE